MESNGPGERTGPAQDRESGRAGKGFRTPQRCFRLPLVVSLAAGRGGGMLCRVEVGVEPPCLVSEEQPLFPLRTWGAVPPRQFSCPLAKVCLDPQFLCFESIELEMRKFLFLFALK